MNNRVYPYHQRPSQPVYQEPVNYHYPGSNQTYSADHYPYEQVSNQSPFEYYSKPSQPENWPYVMPQQSNDYPYEQQDPYYFQQQQLDPYYFQQQQQQQQQNQGPGILAQFQTQEGQMDVQKMLSTVGQLANTVQQVSPVIKEIGAMIRVFR